MIQLILDVSGSNIELPESRKGGYRAELSTLSTDVEMATGRLVRELRGNVWKISYQYGYFDNNTKDAVLAACRKGQQEPIICGFLPPDSGDELLYRPFFVTAITYPKFMWCRFDGDEETTPVWADFAVELREVKPND